MIHLTVPLLKAVYSGKLGLLMAWSLPVCATIAVTEAFLGQLMIAVVVAVIGATPPTVAIILMAKKQSAERAAGNLQLLAGQQAVAKAVDGQLAKFVEAKELVGHAAGVEQERKEQRGREGDAAIAQVAHTPAPVPLPAAAPVVPAEIKIVNKKTDPVPTVAGEALDTAP